MSQASAVVLSSGGLRSLVATAAIVADAGPTRVAVTHLREPRNRGTRMLEMARRQAARYEVPCFIELRMPQQPGTAEADAPTEQMRTSLARSLLLVVGLAQAVQLQAGRLVWPAHSGGRFDLSGRIAEQVVLAESLAQLEQDETPPIETPLLELSDQQVIELGGHLRVPWELAWSCQLHGDKPCRVCAPCRRRHAAFDAAGMVDPIDEVVAVR